ncbi:sulfite exporter TauE/SafE family protein [Streptomyces triticirhizae]|uniref:Probable membrane transporter protein n=1 Tax=Streptomyces triticirhizae TaxID=2483353 RepID=A0A3M2M4X5_9ACTN|nr:sulfite exporter TauE/SafE family protein [Streptomyces triticirhizae]RMI43873.1 sulfite exporter TauE/SafE family protein [Streptomyces triticirhizae]
MTEISTLFLLACAVFVGSALQSGIGLGLGLLGAPALALLEPSLLPGGLLITSMVLPVLGVVSEWRQVDWRGLAWALPARVPGALLGAWLVGRLAPGALAGAVGAMVLLAVAASLWRARLAIRPWSLVGAGALSGVTGTATSIGGPPMALLYQYEPPARVRATLAAFFLLGGAISLAALIAAGELDGRQVGYGLAATPLVVAGFLAGRASRQRVDARVLRAVLLAVVGAAGVGLVARAVLA